MNSTTLSIFLTCGFLFATLATTFYNKTINQDLINELTEKEIGIYKKITIMRRNIYLCGLLLGIFIAMLFLYMSSSKDYYYRILSAIAITFFINYFYYILYPKGIYMLDILDTNKENKAWLKIYRYMQFRYHLAFLFGLLFAFFLYNTILSK
tara:strand:- start:388 stop:843 length:456 start_codon:yes stop_codon:yes gene_type:complete